VGIFAPLSHTEEEFSDAEVMESIADDASAGVLKVQSIEIWMKIITTASQEGDFKMIKVILRI
jgi:hypothetical protein